MHVNFCSKSSLIQQSPLWSHWVGVVLLWQFWKFLFKNNKFTCSSEQPSSIRNALQSFHLMEAQKINSLMVQNHFITNSAWLQPASITGACFPSPVISPLCQLIFGKCPLVPWMHSRACAWPDVLYWLSLTPALRVQSPDQRSLLCSSPESPVLKIFSSRWICAHHHK